MIMEPPYAERHVRWCERTHEEIILMFLLDYMGSLFQLTSKASIVMPRAL